MGRTGSQKAKKSATAKKKQPTSKKPAVKNTATATVNISDARKSHGNLACDEHAHLRRSRNWVSCRSRYGV
jgi:hypothetical protein